MAQCDSEPMEKERKEYILKALPELKEVTNCNDHLLDVMVACGVFCSDDKDEIVSNTTCAYKIYSILYDEYM